MNLQIPRNKNYSVMEYDELNKKREKYLDLIESGLSEEGRKNLIELLEIEREFTLREE